MELSRRNFFVYGILAAIWVLVLGWQLEEHVRFRWGVKADLRNRSKDIATTVGACVRGMRFRGAVFQERLESVLDELVNGRSNELVQASQLLSIALLNAAGEPVAAAGRPIDYSQGDILQKGERWGPHSVTFVNPVNLGARLLDEGLTNPTVVLPPFRPPTNTTRESMPPRERPRGSQFREPPPPPADGPPPGPPPGENAPPEHGGGPGPSNLVGETGAESSSNGPPAFGPGRPPRSERDGRPRRPFWLRGMEEHEFREMMEKRALHGLVLAMSTEPLQTASARDLWLRSLIMALATISVVGSGLAWRNVARSSELQIRLIRASELNTHLREMNLAAAGLAHETRNPLNIIRGLAQMISNRPDSAPEVRLKSREIVDEADKVAAQLNEFINYSRPREVRRRPVSLPAVIGEVTRALAYDLEEKKIGLELKTEPLSIEADEQLLRQALFNLILNAIQAVNGAGQIQISTRKDSVSEAVLEIADNGPGVPPESRREIFKPYFTTQKSGTGLGLAVVQQIVLAHGWEIECLANEPKGARFRVSHLKLA